MSPFDGATPRGSAISTVKNILAAGIAVLSLTTAGLASAQPAHAAGINLCSGYVGCVNAGLSDSGYSAANGTSYWGQIAGHNCTNYVAYRLRQSGVDASWIRGRGNANVWGSVALGRGISVDSTPRVGDVAWWDANSNGMGPSGHVGYVEQVRNGYIVTSEDNYSGDFHWVRRSPGSYYPTAFIHLGGADTALSGAGTLWLMKTLNSGSGRVEVHSATPRSGWTTGTHAATYLTPGDAGNGRFQMVGPDLFFIKTRNTGSGAVEVHSAAAAQGWQSGAHVATAFSVKDADNGTFQMAGGDLIFIKTRNTDSGRVEFFRASAGSGFRSVVTATATGFNLADASSGKYQMQGGDVVFIKTRGTPSGRVEVSRASAASGFTKVTAPVPTAFSVGDADNGSFALDDVDYDGRSDLTFTKFRNAQSGRVEFFVASGASSQSNVVTATQTAFGLADADNGSFQPDSEQ